MQRSMKGWLAPGEVPNFYSEIDSTCSIASSTISTSHSNRCHQSKREQQQTTERNSEQTKNIKYQPDQTTKGNENSNGKNDETGITNDRAPVILYENPKYLRGTVLEDVRRMLRDAESHNFTQIVSWLPSGKTFKIHDNKAFQELVCGKYMKTAKLSYFSDCLRTWGFCRLKEVVGEEQNAYYHRLFQNGKPELCRHISRTQMLDAMKDFKEEQKRQKEISWSLFPHHRQEYRVNRNENDVVDNNSNNKMAPDFKEITAKANHREELNLNAATTAVERERVVDRAEVGSEIKVIDEPPNMVPAASAHPLLQSQDYITGYLDMHNTSNEDDSRNNNNADNGNTMYLSSMRHRYKDNYVIDPNYQSIQPGMATEKASAVFTSNTTRASTGPDDLQMTSSIHQKQNPNSIVWNAAMTERNANMSYAMKIHIMLEEVETKGEKDIISWMPHGRAFKIHDERAFETNILPRHFKATLASFARWLHHWGFIRMTAGKDRKCWYHRLFVRGVIELIRDHTRQELFDAMEEWRDLGTEPDLYSSGTGEEMSEISLVAKRQKMLVKRSKSSIQSDTAGESTSPTTEQKINPRTLRGTIVEDLREMLGSAQVERNAHIVSWLTHGKAFKIYNQDEFEKKIMHLFFKTSKYRYFTDVLRSWGFTKLKEGRDKGAYHHKYFLKNEPKLSQHLSRAQMKASMKDWSKQNVPDFYHGYHPEQKVDGRDVSCLPMERATKKRKAKPKANNSHKKTNAAFPEPPSILPSELF